MSRRVIILEKIRQKIINPGDPDRLRAVETQLSQSPQGLIPARGRLSHDDRVTLFCMQAEAVQATLTRLNLAAELPEALRTYLQSRVLPPVIHMGEDPALRAVEWSKAPELEIKDTIAEKGHFVGLSRAIAGVAETGTLVLVSGKDNPTSLNFLPDTHVVALSTQNIVGDYEAVWQHMRETYGKTNMPRAVNMVTGPSRSGDIEQTILLGAHGPRSLQIFLIDEAWDKA